MSYTFDEWVRFVQSPGGIALMPYEALRRPCPRCGQHQGYQVTNDGYAYCNACGFGPATDYAFTGWALEVFGPDGRPIPPPDAEDVGNVRDYRKEG